MPSQFDETQGIANRKREKWKDSYEDVLTQAGLWAWPVVFVVGFLVRGVLRRRSGARRLVLVGTRKGTCQD
jgi:hypothetical protein